MIPEHLSKDQDIPLAPGDRVEVMTPGGGGYGDPFDARSRRWCAATCVRGYYSPRQARELFGVAIDASGEIDEAETLRLRGGLKRSA